MRKLASVQIIANIEPIPDAKVIRVATVLGWKTVIKEGQYQIGDKCVFVEIDSVFPSRPEFAEFFKRGNRLKTIRLRGQISQGVCLPMNILPSGHYNVGDDVTAILGITKYEAPIPASLAGEVKGAFPAYIPKTDEPRVQTMLDLLHKYQGQKFYFTEKLDGTSATYYLYNNEFGVCSRNLELKENAENTLWKLAKLHAVAERLKSVNQNFSIQGEVIGEGVQKNIYQLHGQKFYIFSIYNIDKHSYLNWQEMVDCLTILNQTENTAAKLELVPFIGTFVLPNNIEAMVKQAIGTSILNPQVQREGLVFRPFARELWDPYFGRVSFKAINPEFLLRYAE